MARYTKDFRKQLRRNPETNKFGWVELTEAERSAAMEGRGSGSPQGGAEGGGRERRAEMGDGAKNPRRWFGAKPDASQAVETGGRGAPQAGGAEGGAKVLGEKERRVPESPAQKVDQPKTRLALDAKTLGPKIVGLHAMAAAFFKNPLITITDKQGEALASAMVDVAAQHSVNINPKYLAYAELAGVCAAVYGPKIMIVVFTSKPAKSNLHSQGPAHPAGLDVLDAGGPTRH